MTRTFEELPADLAQARVAVCRDLLDRLDSGWLSLSNRVYLEAKVPAEDDAQLADVLGPPESIKAASGCRHCLLGGLLWLKALRYDRVEVYGHHFRFDGGPYLHVAPSAVREGLEDVFDRDQLNLMEAVFQASGPAPACFDDMPVGDLHCCRVFAGLCDRQLTEQVPSAGDWRRFLNNRARRVAQNVIANGGTFDPRQAPLTDAEVAIAAPAQ